MDPAAGLAVGHFWRPKLALMAHVARSPINGPVIECERIHKEKAS